MARDFDGTDDKIDFGSDASIDAFTNRSFAAWIRKDVASGTYQAFGGKITGPNGWNFGLQTGTDKPEIAVGFASAPGFWETTSYTYDTSLHHVAYTFTGNAADNPLIYVDGTSQGVTETGTPSGALNSDAASSLLVGEDNGATGDLNGVMAHLCYDNTIWSADTINRHKWWGCAPGGPSSVKVWHPFWTSELANKGTATATGTATGTTVDNASVPRVERMWGSLMGCGR